MISKKQKKETIGGGWRSDGNGGYRGTGSNYGSGYRSELVIQYRNGVTNDELSKLMDKIL